MASFDLSFSSGDEFVRQLSQLTAKIQNSLQELDAQIRPSLSEWQGDTVQQYEIHKQRWDQAAKNMSQALPTTGGQTMDDIIDVPSTDESKLTRQRAG
jgi:early secretory antigenic target protein ESAT-6